MMYAHMRVKGKEKEKKLEIGGNLSSDKAP